MLDITTLLLPELLASKAIHTVQQSEPSHSFLHPSRLQNFQQSPSDQTANEDLSFLPRPEDIARARRLLLKSINPPPPKVPKLTTKEKQARRKAKRDKRNGPIQEHI